MLIDAIYANELREQDLIEVANRGNALIDQCSMRYPIECTLFGDQGEKLASWHLGKGDQPTDSEHESIGERWARSSGGVTLVLEDADGQLCEITLIVVNEYLQSK